MAPKLSTTTHRQPGRLQPKRQGRIGVIVTLSLASGLVAALMLLAAPFIKAQENVLTGVVLLGFAFGWALVAVLSIRFSDQPQRWAAAPALFFALAGVISLIGSEAVSTCLGLDMAASTARARGVDGHWCTPAPAQPNPAVAAVPTAGGVGAGLGGRRLRDRAGVDRCGRLPRAGPVIDVGGHRLHLSCIGSGSPTVVLEPGRGEGSRRWRGSRRPWRGHQSVRV